MYWQIDRRDSRPSRVARPGFKTTNNTTNNTKHNRPTLLATPPDLLDPVTYREEDATAFFQRVEDAMKTAPNAAETFPVRYVCVRCV